MEPSYVRPDSAVPPSWPVGDAYLTAAEASLPALIAVSSGINEPRYPQLKGIMAAKKKEIKVYTAADLGIPADQVGEKGAKEKVLTVGRPPKRQAGKVVVDEGEGGKQIADYLAEIKVI